MSQHKKTHPNRRDFLRATATLGAVAAAGPILARPLKMGTDTDLGVASGDPHSDGVVLWTRLPESQHTSTPAVIWEVSLSEIFTSGEIVASGTVTTSSAVDYTVKVRVTGLRSFTRYWYRFRLGSWISSVGRTHTAPGANDDVSEVNFAFTSCQSYPDGLYNVYAALAQDDVHVVAMLGDNIYEGGGSEIREDTVGSANTLDQYRAKYRLYLSDPDYREARRLFPFIHIWDDHEVYNNYAGGGEMDSSQRARQAAGYQAFIEYLPVDPTVQLTTAAGIPAVNLYRRLKYGKLLEFFAIDGRQYREGQPCGRDFLVYACDDLYAADRTFLGEEQLAWLRSGLVTTDARWKVVLNPVIMMAMKLTNNMVDILGRVRQDGWVETTEGLLINTDQWDGFPAERQSILGTLEGAGVKNLVVVTGDIHNCFAGLLKTDYTKRFSEPMGVEIVGGSVSSTGIAEVCFGRDLTDLVTAGLKPVNPHITFVDAYFHVYVRMTVTATETLVSYVAVDTITEKPFEIFDLKSMRIPEGQAALEDV